MQSPQYLVLSNASAPRKSSRRALKLTIAGTVAIVGAVASLCLLQTQNAPSTEFKLYGDFVQQENTQAFMQFLAKYGKTYATKSEINSKFEVFSKNYDAIKEHNLKNPHFQKAVNQYADMTVEEFSNTYLKGLKVPSHKKLKSTNTQSHPKLSESNLPEKVDWQEAGKVLAPQNQGSCGSCWAFTSATTLESAIAIKENKAPERLSVQYLVDCDTSNFGCGGGWMLDAYEFVRTHGIVKEEDYPSKYVARKNNCQDMSSKAKVYNNDENEEDSISIQRLKELVATQPVGVAMYSNPSCLMSYRSGSLREEDCHCSDANSTTVNHAVTVVGYGKNEGNDECPEYWKIKNSWGADWGDNGFFKLCIPKDTSKTPTGTCQVLSYVQVPLI